MTNPYIQVARTYLRRPVSLLQRSLVISIITGILFLHAFNFFSRGWILQFYLFPFIFLFSYWGIHVKEQFAAPRASLTPDFRKVHGVVAIIVVVAFIILLPGVTALLIERQPIGLISITMFLSGIILWALLRLGNSFIPLIMVGWIFTIFEPIRNVIEKIISGDEPVQTLIIISIGAILSITGLIRLFLLNEENPEYHLNFKSPIYDVRGWRRWFVNRSGVRMIYHARHAADSYWSRMLRWNFFNRYVLGVLFLTISFKILFTLMGFFNDTINFNGATMIPIFFVYMEFKKKSRFMAQDLMMPVRRDSYLKELGSSIAFSQFTAWALAVAVSIAWVFIAAVKSNPEFYIYSITYSVMIQIWLFGLAVWIFSSRITPLILLFATVIPVQFMSALEVQMPIPRWPLILGVILACLGLLLTWRGYRRWLVADFESEQKDENVGVVLFNKRTIM